MTRVIEIEMETRCKKFETALRRFFKKYADLDYWKETFEYMYEHGEDFFCDNVMADGTDNIDWRYALHLDVNSGYADDTDMYYFCIIERA